MNSKGLKLLFIILILSGCRFKSYNVEIYGVVKDNQVDRMGIPRNDFEKGNSMIAEEYGVYFLPNFAIESFSRKEKYYIKFYDNITITIKGKKYVMLKENIDNTRYKSDKVYTYADLPIDIYEYDNYILDLGEIEIISSEGEIIKFKRRIPPLLFKKTFNYFKAYIREGLKTDYYIYEGWAEDYKKNKKKAIEDYKKFQQEKEK